MNTTILEFPSLPFNRAKSYAAAALFVLGNIALPQLCHLVPQGGQLLLPIYLFTLVAAYAGGRFVGLLTAVASPLLNALLFGMPAPEALPVILFKSVVLALAASAVAARYRRVSIGLLTAVVLGYQLVGGLFEWAWSGSLAAALQDFRLGAAGMILQILLGRLLILRLLKR